jgi:hypothetical protein
MANLLYDELLSFGTANLASDTAFPDVLNVGKETGKNIHYPGKEWTGIDRLTVDICAGDAKGGTSITASVQGCDTPTGTFAVVGQGTFTLAQLQAGPCGVAISPNNYQYFKVTFTKAGTFTGNAKAYLNTYTGW